MEEPGNARVVPAPELVRAARGVVAPVRGFVRLVGTVHAAVAHPRLDDAVAAVFALELVGTALRHSGGLRRATLYVYKDRPQTLGYDTCTRRYVVRVFESSASDSFGPIFRAKRRILRFYYDVY